MSKSATYKSAALLMAVLLAGCSGNTEERLEMQEYVSSVVNRPPGNIEPLPEFVSYEAFTYSAAGQRSPFNVPVTVRSASGEEEPVSESTVQPDQDRDREPLEQFEISALEMVGTLSRGDTVWALVQDQASNIHRVTVGNYIGRNYGRIESVDESQIDIVEIVPNGAGGWIERPQTMTLEE